MTAEKTKGSKDGNGIIATTFREIMYQDREL